MIGGPLQKDDQIAQQRVGLLQQKEIDAEIVPASAVPDAGEFIETTVLVVVPRFATEDAAQDFCDNVLPQVMQETCDPVRVE